MTTERMAAVERTDAPTTVAGALEVAAQIHQAATDHRDFKIDGLLEEIGDLRDQIRDLEQDEGHTISHLRVQAIEHGRELAAEQTRRCKAEAAVVKVREALADWRTSKYLHTEQLVAHLNTITKDIPCP